MLFRSGDFGPISAKLWTGTQGNGPRGVLRESWSFDMSRADDAQPDFFARYGQAYDAELGAFIDHARRGNDCAPGLDIGWKTLLVAELAERSSREGGRAHSLVMRNGGSICTASDAAAFFAAR